MARFQPILGRLSGRLGDDVYAHNQAGQYVRDFVASPGAPSSRQYNYRLKFAQVSYAWANTLTPEQRANWEIYARNVTLTGRFARPYRISARAHYIRSNVVRIHNLLSRVDDAPTLYDLGDFNRSAIRFEPYSSSYAYVHFDDDEEWVTTNGAKLLLQTCPAGQAETVNFWKGPYVTISGIPGQAFKPKTSPQLKALPGYFPSPGHGFWRARLSHADGRLTTPTRGYWYQG